MYDIENSLPIAPKKKVSEKKRQAFIKSILLLLLNRFILVPFKKFSNIPLYR